MAFSRTAVKFARSDVHPALTKYWKKYYKIDGQVTRHLSPFEQRIVSPMFKDAHTKVFKRVFEFVLEAGPGLAVGIATYKWANAEFERQAHTHRP